MSIWKVEHIRIGKTYYKVFVYSAGTPPVCGYLERRRVVGLSLEHVKVKKSS